MFAIIIFSTNCFDLLSPACWCCELPLRWLLPLCPVAPLCADAPAAVNATTTAKVPVLVHTCFITSSLFGLAESVEGVQVPSTHPSVGLVRTDRSIASVWMT